MAASRDATFRLRTESDASGVDELSAAMARAEAAVKKLSDPTLSPRALQQGVIAADIATENLAAAMTKAKATGGPVTPAMTAQLKSFETAVVSANVRAGQLRDRMGDLRSQGNLAGQGIETLAQSLGSAQGAAQFFANQNNALVQSLAKVGLSVLILKEGLALLDEGAKNVVAGSKALGDAYVSNVEKQAKATTAAYTHELALRAVSKGLITAGGSALELDKRFESLISGTNRAAKELQDFANGAGVKVPESFFKLQQAAFGMETTLALAFTRGKADFLDWATTNETRLKQIEAEYNRHGVRVPEYIAKAIAALKREGEQIALNTKLVEDQKNALENLVKQKAAEQTANYKVADSIKAVIAEAARSIAAAESSAETAKRTAEEKIRALKQEQISDEEYNARKRQILKEMDAAVMASADEENAANKKAEEANRALATQYGLTGEQMKKALQDAKNLAEGTNAARDADESLKGMAEKLAEAMANQEKTWGPNKTEADKWTLAIKEVAQKTQEAATKTEDLADQFEQVKEGASSTAEEVGKVKENIKAVGEVSLIAQGRLAALLAQIKLVGDGMDETARAAKRMQDAIGAAKT